MNEEIPGIVPGDPPVPDDWTLVTCRGKGYSFHAVKGKPLEFGRLGSIPHQVMKKAIKAWRKVNPPAQEIQPWRYPRLRNKYHAYVFIPLLEARGLIKDGKVLQ